MRKIILIAAIVSPIIIVLTYLYSLNNEALTKERHIRKFSNNSLNILGGLYPKLKELNQVRELSAADERKLQEVIFGEGGRASNNAIFQMITEDNAKTDTTIHKQMAQIIEADRNAFKNAQTLLLEVCDPYLILLDTPIDGTILSWLNYPDKHMKKGQVSVLELCKPVMSSHAQEAERTRTDDGITL